MELKELLEMPFGEVLEKYVVLWNYECCYPYGVCTVELADRMYEEFDVQSYAEAMTTEPIVHFEVLDMMDGDLIEWEGIEKAMDNLGIMRKDEQV